MAKEKKKKTNTKFLFLNIYTAVLLLCVFGLIMVYSASAYHCAQNPDYGYDSMYLLKRQAAFMVIGIAAVVIGNFIDFRKWYLLAVCLYPASIFCIGLLMTPLGVAANGATRWLKIGGIQFQVAELCKISVILILAMYISIQKKEVDKARTTWNIWFLGGIPACMLFVISNDLSSALVILGITFLISFLFCKTEKMHFRMLGFVFVAAGGYIFNIAAHLPTPEELEDMPFRVARIAAWLSPETYAAGKGYQVLQALYAIGRGGIMGSGLGNSLQKLGSIPEAQNDMIFSIICEELGIFGANLVIILFLYLLYMFLLVGINCKKLFDRVVVVGIMVHIGLQTAINIAVNCNFFPNTGLPLPFISYGGTSVFLMLCEVALVVSIARFGVQILDDEQIAIDERPEMDLPRMKKLRRKRKERR